MILEKSYLWAIASLVMSPPVRLHGLTTFAKLHVGELIVDLHS